MFDCRIHVFFCNRCFHLNFMNKTYINSVGFDFLLLLFKMFSPPLLYLKLIDLFMQHYLYEY